MNFLDSMFSHRSMSKGGRALFLYSSTYLLPTELYNTVYAYMCPNYWSVQPLNVRQPATLIAAPTLHAGASRLHLLLVVSWS